MQIINNKYQIITNSLWFIISLVEILTYGATHSVVG